MRSRMMPKTSSNARAFDGSGTDAFIPVVLDALGRRPGRVLEVGCGKSALADVLSTIATEVTAIDSDPAAIEFQLRQRRHSDNLHYRCIDGRTSVEPAFIGDFDAVVSMFTFHEWSLADLLVSIRRWMPSGGKLVVVDTTAGKCQTVASRVFEELVLTNAREAKATRATARLLGWQPVLAFSYGRARVLLSRRGRAHVRCEILCGTPPSLQEYYSRFAQLGTVNRCSKLMGSVMLAVVDVAPSVTRTPNVV